MGGLLDLEKRKLVPNPADVFRELAKDASLFGPQTKAPRGPAYASARGSGSWAAS
ncbi:hypothetical protein STENM223S_03683 [Streptomyces tendae]